MTPRSWWGRWREKAPALVFPIGHDLGTLDPGGGKALSHQVRLGEELADLSAEEYEAWTLAHGREARPPGEPHGTAGRLRDVADSRTIAGLVRRGLLAEVVPGSARSVGFAKAHRLLPLALGLALTSPLVTVGLLGEPRVRMTRQLFALWAVPHSVSSLWEACQAATSTGSRPDRAGRREADPKRLLAEALAELHPLLAARVACLDQLVVGTK